MPEAAVVLPAPFGPARITTCRSLIAEPRTMFLFPEATADLAFSSPRALHPTHRPYIEAPADEPCVCPSHALHPLYRRVEPLLQPDPSWPACRDRTHLATSRGC